MPKVSAVTGPTYYISPIKRARARARRLSAYRGTRGSLSVACVRPAALEKKKRKKKKVTSVSSQSFLWVWHREHAYARRCPMIRRTRAVLEFPDAAQARWRERRATGERPATGRCLRRPVEGGMRAHDRAL